MQLQDFTYLLQNPELITSVQTNEIENIIEEFPYFQPAHALYLKGLKNKESIKYNQALKTTAAYTTDRSILFDYITSKTFNQNEISLHIKHNSEHIKNIIVNDSNHISADTKPTPEQTLNIGRPLTFNNTETHSFSEWLKITTFAPIHRKPTSKKPEEKKVLSINKNFELIDKFLSNNPKIEPAKVPQSGGNLAKTQKEQHEGLMTETLAQIYLEQKNYKKAIQSYKILSLKYPEKSGFFADQIKAIKQLQEKNNT